jgi:hypothetical protein
LASKWRVNTKVDLSKLDPNLKVIISQCDITRGSYIVYRDDWASMEQDKKAVRACLMKNFSSGF